MIETSIYRFAGRMFLIAKFAQVMCQEICFYWSK